MRNLNPAFKYLLQIIVAFPISFFKKRLSTSSITFSSGKSGYQEKEGAGGEKNIEYRTRNIEL